MVLPRVSFLPTVVGTEPFLSSTCRWSEEDEWSSFLACTLPKNMAGCRYRPVEPPGPSMHGKSVRRHVARVAGNLRRELTRKWWSDAYEQVVHMATASATSKCTIVAKRLHQPGPPLHIVLDHISLPSHRSALSSLLCGDWFLACHARNYFARNLVPQTTTRIAEAAESSGCEANMICLSCWHYRRVAVLEDVFHVVCVCPEYERARQDFLSTGITLDHSEDMLKIFGCSSKPESEHLAQFLVRTRQLRRRLKASLTQLNETLLRTGFAAKRAAWRFKGRTCCRHGVLFTRLPEGGCKCMEMSSSTDSDWELARFMPALSYSLKAVVAVPFHREAFRRLNILQHRARTLGW